MKSSGVRYLKEFNRLAKQFIATCPLTVGITSNVSATKRGDRGEPAERRGRSSHEAYPPDKNDEQVTCCLHSQN